MGLIESITRSRYYPLPRTLIFPEETRLLKRWAMGRRSLVEIGVFEGASARSIRAAMHRKGFLTLIDPVLPDSMNESLRARPFFTRLSLWSWNRRNLRWIRDYSHVVSKTWAEPIDFLFIDGDHRYEACLQDWMEWSKHVVPGGIVVFHDARKGRSGGRFWDGFDGPTRVVDALFRDGGGAVQEWKIVDEARTAVVVQRLI